MTRTLDVHVTSKVIDIGDDRALFDFNESLRDFAGIDDDEPVGHREWVLAGPVQVTLLNPKQVLYTATFVLNEGV